MNLSTQSKTLAILIVCYFAVRLPWLFMVPMSEAPDEFSHFWVLNFMSSHLALPDSTQVADGGASAVYGSLPQIGYLPHVFFALLLSPFKAIDISLSSRLGSLFAGLVTMLAAVYFANFLFKDKLCRLALPLLIIFHPQLILVHAYANNDSSTMALTSLALLLVCEILRKGPGPKLNLLLGSTLGFAALTKYSGFAIFPAVALGLFLSFHLFKAGLKKSLLCLATVGGTTLVLSAWWFLRNYQMYAGDLLGTKTMFRTWALTYNRSLDFHMTPWQVVKQHRWWRTILFSYWGLFGYMNKYMWKWVYYTYMVFQALSLALLFKDFPKLKSIYKAAQEQGDLAKLYTWAVFAALILVNLSAMVYASTVNLGGPQGRYLFPSEIAIIAFLVAGLSRAGKFKTPLLSILLVFNMAVAIGAFLYLQPLYGWHFTKTY